MKSFEFIYILLFAFFVSTSLYSQENNDSIIEAPPYTELDQEFSLAHIEQAAQAYRDQDYQRSIELYEEAVAQGLSNNMVSPQIYYNLGNAHFRDGNLGKAILNYERALLLDPGDGDIRHNLRFANNRKVDRIAPAGDLFLSNWFKSVRDLFSSNVWSTVGIVLFLMFLVAVGIYLFVRVLWARKASFYSGIVIFIFMIIVNIFAFSQKNERIRGDSAIVMSGAATVNASPDINSNLLFELHEGTKVRIRNSDNNWYEVEIENGSVGWTLKENVEII